ncbi:MAG: pteridine reductase [Panacagrimonas sp.]
MEQQDRVVLITGAGRRIGAAIARSLHAQGARVLLHCRESMQAAQSLVDEFQALRPDSARVLRADLLNLDALRDLAHEAHASWGRLDALINNASTYYATPLSTLSAPQFDDLIGSNLRAPLFLSQACAPLLGDGGSIINILDVHARRPVSGFSAYLAAKSALWTLTEALALELAPRLRVNAVAPGHMIWAVDSQLDQAAQAREQARVPLRRLGGGDEIANAVRFLLSPASSYLNGAIIPVDGGLRLS